MHRMKVFIVFFNISMYSHKQLALPSLLRIERKTEEEKENIKSHITLQSQAHWMLKSEYSKRLQNLHVIQIQSSCIFTCKLQLIDIFMLKNTLGVKKCEAGRSSLVNRYMYNQNFDRS